MRRSLRSSTRLRRVLVRKYMADAAPLILPQAVELPVEGVIAGVRVHGIVDLLDMEGRIIDFKTAARRPAGITPEYCLQLTTYSRITPGSSGSCRLDTVTKTRTVELVQQNCEIGAEDRRYAETLYPMVQEAMRDGIYPPRRSSRVCCRRYCGYWRECEREFGGRVDD